MARWLAVVGSAVMVGAGLAGCGDDAPERATTTSPTSSESTASTTEPPSLEGRTLSGYLTTAVNAGAGAVAVLETAETDQTSRGLALYDDDGGVEAIAAPIDETMIVAPVWITETAVGVLGVPCRRYEPGTPISIEDEGWVLEACGDATLMFFRYDRAKGAWDPPQRVGEAPTAYILQGAGRSRIIISLADDIGEGNSSPPVGGVVYDIDVDRGTVTSIEGVGSKVEGVCPVGDEDAVEITTSLSEGGAIGDDGVESSVSGGTHGLVRLYSEGTWTEVDHSNDIAGVEGCVDQAGFVSDDAASNRILNLVEGRELTTSPFPDPPATGHLLITQANGMELAAIENSSDEPAPTRVWVFRSGRWVSLGDAVIGSGDHLVARSDSVLVLPDQDYGEEGEATVFGPVTLGR